MSFSQESIDALFIDTGRTPPPLAVAPPPPQPIAQPQKKIEPDMSRILGMGVTVTVVLAQRDMAIENILETTVGTIIEFDVMFDAELILEVGGQPIGKGQAVKVGENFGLRIVEMGSIEERITAMGQS